ncbi:hypothetical protein LENED_010451 [Lentinula edodes]|uniref:Uncharacterized protein n=1 Tax=Lentinula edodes TaxID=5353 RepID=A0A1Q3EMF3_LENED|nr:hypothetical protein LENED_010451 [Lentinula edodes]
MESGHAIAALTPSGCLLRRREFFGSFRLPFRDRDIRNHIGGGRIDRKKTDGTSRRRDGAAWSSSTDWQTFRRISWPTEPANGWIHIDFTSDRQFIRAYEKVENQNALIRRRHRNLMKRSWTKGKGHDKMKRRDFHF